MLSTKIRKFISRKVSLFIITFLVTVSAIALAGNILTWETVPTTGQAISTSRWTKIHNFINWWTDINWYAAVTSWTLIVKWSTPTADFSTFADKYTAYIANIISARNTKYRPALFVNGNTTIRDNLTVWNTSTKSKIRVYWQIQLSTLNLDWDTELGVAASCNTGAIWTIRLALPITAWTRCPLQICYPWTQWINAGVSRKSACDTVTFSTNPDPIRNQSAIELPPLD